MKARAIAVVLALGALVALAVPAGAAAKPGTYKVPGSTSESIVLHGTHGYRVSLFVTDRRPILSASKSTGHHGVLLTTYSLRHRLPAGPDLHFRLGKEGEVDLRFVLDHTVEHAYPECEGGPEISEVGHFVGTLRLRGRGGFTQVDTHRVRGSVTRVHPRTCHRRKSSGTSFGLIAVSASKGVPPVPMGALELIAGTPDGHLHLEALRFEEPASAGSEFGTFEAWIENREGGAIVTSSAFGVTFGEGLVSPEPTKPLSAATVEPAAPFSGSATFQMTSPRHGEWSGDLAVELPGYGRVPLTGPKIAAGLCKTNACTPTLPKSLRPRTGGEKAGAAGNFEGNFFSE
jgi:hypothetical protein